MSMKEFDQYLKASHHFADIINTHRVATAEIIAGFAGLLRDGGILTEAQIKALLRKMEDSVSGPSIDGSRRMLAARIGDALQKGGQ